MITVVNNVAILIIFSLIGWVLCKTKILSSENSKMLSVLEVWLFLPCKMFKSFSSNFTIDYICQKYMIFVISAVLIAVIVFSMRLIVPKFIKDKDEQRICRYSLAIANYGYMGYALAENLYGEAVLLDMMLFAIPVSLYIYTAGYRMLTGQGKISLNRVLNPVITAIILGGIFGLTQIKLPSLLMSVVNSSSACMSPVSMLLAGMLISDFDLKELIADKRVYIISALRLLVIPFVICLVLSRFCSKEIVTAAMLIYSMPCGLNTIIFRNLAGNNRKIGVSLPFISTVFSLITIPIMYKGVELLCSL